MDGLFVFQNCLLFYCKRNILQYFFCRNIYSDKEQSETYCCKYDTCSIRKTGCKLKAFLCLQNIGC